MKSHALAVAAGLCVSVWGVAPHASAQESDPFVITGLFEAPNGELFNVTKTTGPGNEAVVYERNGVSYSPEQLKEYIAAHPVPVLDPSLRAVALANRNQTFAVTVLLQSRPGTPIAREVWERLRPQMEMIVKETA